MKYYVILTHIFWWSWERWGKVTKGNSSWNISEVCVLNFGSIFHFFHKLYGICKLAHVQAENAKRRWNTSPLFHQYSTFVLSIKFKTGSINKNAWIFTGSLSETKDILVYEDFIVIFHNILPDWYCSKWCSGSSISFTSGEC